MPRQEVVVFDERKSCRRQFFSYLLGRNAALNGRPDRQIRLEVDDRKPPARTQRRLQLGEIRDPVSDVMIGVHHKNEVDGLGEVCGIRIRLHRHKVFNMLALRALLR